MFGRVVLEIMGEYWVDTIYYICRIRFKFINISQPNYVPKISHQEESSDADPLELKNPAMSKSSDSCMSQQNLESFYQFLGK